MIEWGKIALEAERNCTDVILQIWFNYYFFHLFVCAFIFFFLPKLVDYRSFSKLYDKYF